MQFSKIEIYIESDLVTPQNKTIINRKFSHVLTEVLVVVVVVVVVAVAACDDVASLILLSAASV